MTTRWRHWWRKQQFRPSALSVFFNPSYLLRSRLHTALSRRLSEAKGVTIDVGCGSKPYRAIVNSNVYLGIEVQQSGHTHEHEHVDIYYDGSQLPIATESADLVLCCEVLEHTSNPKTLLQEILRILRPGGTLVLTVPFAWGEHEQPFDEQRWTWYGLRHLLADTGYSNCDIERVGHHIETIFQLLAAYVHQRILPKQKLANAALVPFFISPILIAGRILSLLPKQDNLYMNLVAQAKRPFA
jgi:SAM-dependent methyltransferase